MKVSVIIPTYNRQDDLKRCLASLMYQTVAPYEVVIVDDSDKVDIEQYLKQMWGDPPVIPVRGVPCSEIVLRYIRHRGERSLARCENLGVRHASGDIVLILDDDVVLDEHYIEEIVRTYVSLPEVLGVQGFITNAYTPCFVKNQLRKYLCKHGFFYAYREHERCRVWTDKINPVPSDLHTTYPYKTRNMVFCEWLSGCNNSWRRRVFDEFQFDENLLGYSDGEDVDFSYRVYKRYPGSLVLNPRALLVHHAKKK